MSAAPSSKNPFLDPQLTGSSSAAALASTSAVSPNLGAEAFGSVSSGRPSGSANAEPLADAREGLQGANETAGRQPSSGSRDEGQVHGEASPGAPSPSMTHSPTRLNVPSSAPTYAPPSIPPPDHLESSISPSISSRQSPPTSTFAPPPGPPPTSASNVHAFPSSPLPGPTYAPTTQPTPGRPLLKNGRLLVYPLGFHCTKCMNTGYKAFDPTHPCKKCWSAHSLPCTRALLASFGISTSASASSSSSSSSSGAGAPFVQTGGRTLQKPLPMMNASGPGSSGGPWAPPPHQPPPLQAQHSGWQQPMHTGASTSTPWMGPWAPPPHPPPPGIHPALAARPPVHRTEEAREAERSTAASTSTTAGAGAGGTTGDGVDEDGVPTGEAPPAYDEVVGNAARNRQAHGPSGGLTVAPTSLGPGPATYASPTSPPPQHGTWSGGAPYGAAAHQGSSYGYGQGQGQGYGHGHGQMGGSPGAPGGNGPPGHNAWMPPSSGPWSPPAPPQGYGLPHQPHPPPHHHAPYPLHHPHPHHQQPHPNPLVVAPGDPRMGGQLCPKCGGDGTRTTFLGLVEETCNTCRGAGRVFR